MSRWSEMSSLRLEMDMLQAKIKWLHKKDCDIKTISYKVGVPEKSVRVILKYLLKSKKGQKVKYER